MLHVFIYVPHASIQFMRNQMVRWVNGTSILTYFVRCAKKRFNGNRLHIGSDAIRELHASSPSIWLMLTDCCIAQPSKMSGQIRIRCRGDLFSAFTEINSLRTNSHRAHPMWKYTWLTYAALNLWIVIIIISCWPMGRYVIQRELSFRSLN